MDTNDTGRQTPFHMVSDMEDDVESLIDYGRVIARLADTLADDESGMIARLGWQVVCHAQSVKHTRALLFHALHPNRAELDAEAERTED
ncbi:hypothetical protein [Bradyrhizobium sp. URHC0002]